MRRRWGKRHGKEKLMLVASSPSNMQVLSQRRRQREGLRNNDNIK